MKRTFTAALLAASLIGGAGVAHAQSNVATMDVGLSMLELAVTNELTRLGIESTDTMELSLSQLAQIRSVFASSDYNRDDKKRQIETIIER